MNGNEANAFGVQSAYTSNNQVRASEHYSHVRVLGPVLDLYVRAPADPLGFSHERWLSGEADAAAGRVQPLSDVMDGLRARVRGHGS